MVGVPGRSKGCSTCRKRKIACGLQRPVCVQCVRSKRVCGGYDRERKFILVQPGEEMHSSPSSEREQPQGETSSETSSSPSGDIGSVSGDLTVLIPHRNDGAIQRGSAHDMITNAMVRNGLALSFLESRFPESNISPATGKAHWISLLPFLPVEVKALESATAALSTAALGRLHCSPVLVRESLRLYTQGLRELQIALYSRKLMHQTGTLAACMALTMYEILECPDNKADGYASHCQGILALIRSRGVSAHTSFVDHSLFLGARFFGIFYSLERQVSTFLSRPIWIEGPWKDLPKTPLDRITDCLTRAPGILQETLCFPFLTHSQKLKLAQKLAKQCWEISNTLESIYDEIVASSPYSLYWPDASLADNISNHIELQKPFTISYRFPDLRTAATVIFYWATSVMVYSGLCNLHDMIDHLSRDEPENTIPRDTSLISVSRGETGSDNSGYPRLGHRRNYRELVSHVCRSVEYALQDSFVLWGAAFMSSCIGLIVGSIRENPEFSHEVAWMREVLKIVQKRGLRLLTHTTP